MRTKTHIAPVARKHLALFDHRGSLLLLYSSVAALSLALVLTLEFGVGFSPGYGFTPHPPNLSAPAIRHSFSRSKGILPKEEFLESRRGSHPAAN